MLIDNSGITLVIIYSFVRLGVLREVNENLVDRDIIIGMR